MSIFFSDRNWRIIFSIKNNLKLLILLFGLIVVSNSNAQQLLNTSPNVVQLSDKPAPIITPAGQPVVYDFGPQVSTGESLITAYNILKAKPINPVNGSFCSSNGTIWFATNGEGIGRYDGKTITFYKKKNGLADNHVNCITGDKSGNIWIGTSDGISKFDGNVFTTYKTNQGLANDDARSILVSRKGEIWIGTDIGVSKFDGISFTNYSSQISEQANWVYNISEDHNGNIWLGTIAGLIKFDGVDFKVFNSKNGLATNQAVFSTVQDDAGNLWIGTKGDGIGKISFTDNKQESIEEVTFFRSKDGLVNNSVNMITEGIDGSFWIATEGGASNFNPETNSFTNYTTKNGLPHNNIWCITLDRSGNIWFGAIIKLEDAEPTGGIGKLDTKGNASYDGKSFITLTTDQGLASNTVVSILEDTKGNIWFGTDGGGVSKYDGRGFETFSSARGLENNYIRSLFEDSQGNIWLGSYGGVYKYDGRSIQVFTTEDGLINNSVISINEDNKGNMWFGTENGLSIFDGKSFTQHTTTNGLLNNTIVCIFRDNNDGMWLGTSGGAAKYDGSKFNCYITETGLSNNLVQSLAQDISGNIWIGTYGGGINILKAGTNSFIKVTTSNGLPENEICAIRKDANDNITVGSKSGIIIIPPYAQKELISKISEGNTTYKFKYEPYNRAAGYNISDVNTGQNNGSMIIDRSGAIWIGNGSSGIARLETELGTIKTGNPTVVINQIKLKGQNVSFYNLLDEVDATILEHQERFSYGKVLSPESRDSIKSAFSGVTFDGITPFYSLPENLKLTYDHNALTFEFSAIETGRNMLVNYQYMLEGMEKDWNPPTKKTEATYNNLREGKYTFLVKAQNPNGQWGEPVAFEFRVLPPWHRTWWAYSTYFLIFAGIVYGFVRWQTSRLKKRQRELENEIAKATGEIKTQKEEIEKSHQALMETHNEISDSIKYAERLQRAILPSANTINQHLKDHFVLFQPKDVVSGDFYWLQKVGGSTLFAAADCTGHGVPGAMVSVVCSNALNRTVKEFLITEPSKILDKTRSIVIDTFARSGEGVKDGMDIALCSILPAQTKLSRDSKGNMNTLKTFRVLFSGANNPLWVVRNTSLISEVEMNDRSTVVSGSHAILQYKTDKQPVGLYEGMTDFSQVELNLQEGDVIYIFTDGFADQFGGDKNKKLMYKPFKKLLLSIHKKDMNVQKNELQKFFIKWKGKNEQVDDVCVIGVRL